MDFATSAGGWRWISALVVLSWASNGAWADEPRPRKPDSPVKMRPEHAHFSFEVTPREVVPGSKVTCKVAARIDEPWHIYDYNKNAPDDGPLPTQFEFFDLQGLKIVGDWKADRKPIKRHEAGFPKVEFVYFFEETVTWSIELEVPVDAKPGKRILKNKITFETCRAGSCWPSTTITLPEVAVEVKAKPVAKP